MKRLLTLISAILLSTQVFAQAQLLESGPMVGYSDFREALIWVQTKKATSVKIGYFAQGEKERFTEEFLTTKEDDFIAKIRPHEVNYGTKYTYKLYLNNQYVPRPYLLEFETQTLWQYRMDPPDFSFAIGSCYYATETSDDRPGLAYGGGYNIFNNILEKDPGFMVWLGDNIYLRNPDFLGERGIRHRNRHARALPELQPLLGSVHHYAIWDDHDYGPNDADASYVNKKLTEKAFNDYWGNPNTNVTGEGGITGQFVWNDVEFFLMDNRYHRDPNKQVTPNRNYLGKEQLDWLIRALRFSTAPFKIVCIGGQTINNAAVYENYANYTEERQRLLDRLEEEKIEGVLFMSGDRHHTEISRLERPLAYPLIDITCSPLTSGTHKKRDEGYTNQVYDKTFYDRNFGIVKVSGPRKNRLMTLSIFNVDGDDVWEYRISEKELRYPKK